ncbi:hypothetical protein Pelo_4303 [Pelomyxa schiedti]|nr:hypothetical protein Pelo_4303 [Pelomyxa schiedti]
MARTSQWALSLMLTLCLRDQDEAWRKIGLSLVSTGACSLNGDGDANAITCGEDVLRLSGFPALSETVYVELSLSNFFGAKLENIDFSGVCLSGCSFEKAELFGVHFNNSCLDSTVMSRAVLDHTDFTGASLIESKFTEAIIKNSTSFDYSNLWKADLSHIRGEGADFKCAYLCEAHLDLAILKGACMESAVVSGTDFLKCDAMNSSPLEVRGFTLEQLRGFGSVAGPHPEFKIKVENQPPIENALQQWIKADTCDCLALPKGNWMEEPDWVSPPGTTCNVKKSDKLWEILVQLIHSTSDTETFQSGAFEFARLKKAAEHGSLLQFLYQEVWSPPQYQGKTESVTIHDIKVINNPLLWARYHETRRNIATSLKERGISTPLAGVCWHAPLENGLPVLNAEIGECWLLHGTNQLSMKQITKTGFNANFSKYNWFTGYGALGKGIYCSDSFSKVSTYVQCPECLQNDCSCDALKAVLLCRVVLGNVYVDKTKSHKWDDKIPAGYDSAWGPFSKLVPDSSFSSNEFCLGDAQIYPEFCIFYKSNTSTPVCDNGSTCIPTAKQWSAQFTEDCAPLPILQALDEFHFVLQVAKDPARYRASLSKLFQVCCKQLELDKTGAVAQAIEKLLLEVDNEGKGLQSTSILPAQMYSYFKARGDNFFSSSEWEKAIFHYKMALGIQLNLPDAELFLNTALSSYNFTQRKNEAMVFFRKAHQIDPEVSSLGVPFSSRLSLTYLSLELLLDSMLVSTEPSFVPSNEWVKRTFSSLCDLFATKEVSSSLCETFYWKLDWRYRNILVEEFLHQSRSPEIRYWLESIPISSSGQHIPSTTIRTQWQNQLHSFCALSPLQFGSISISWLDDSSRLVLAPLKQDCASVLFNADGSLKPSNTPCRILRDNNKVAAYCVTPPNQLFRRYYFDDLRCLLSGDPQVSTLTKITHPNKPNDPYLALMIMALDQSDLTPKTFTWRVIESFLLHPLSDTFDNIITGNGWLPVVDSTGINEESSTISSVLLKMPQMKEKIDFHAVTAFLELDPHLTLSSWLKTVQINVQHIQQLVGGHFTREPDLQTDVIQLLERFLILQHFLNLPIAKQWTHEELLKSVGSGFFPDVKHGSCLLPMAAESRSGTQSNNVNYLYGIISNYRPVYQQFLNILTTVQQDKQLNSFTGASSSLRQEVISHLNFSQLGKFGEDVFEECIKSKDTFSALALHGVMESSGVLFEHLLERSSGNLLTLGLYSCEIHALDLKFSNLHTLCLDRCDMLYFQAQVPHLQVLFVNNCQGLGELSLSLGDNLMALEIKNCCQLSTLILEAPLGGSGFPKIQKFLISKCDALNLSKCSIPALNPILVHHYQFNSVGFWLQRYTEMLTSLFSDGNNGDFRNLINQSFLPVLQTFQFSHLSYKDLDEIVFKYKTLHTMASALLQKELLQQIAGNSYQKEIGFTLMNVLRGHPSLITGSIFKDLLFSGLCKGSTARKILKQQPALVKEEISKTLHTSLHDCDLNNENFLAQAILLLVSTNALTKEEHRHALSSSSAIIFSAGIKAYRKLDLSHKERTSALHFLIGERNMGPTGTKETTKTLLKFLQTDESLRKTETVRFLHWIFSFIPGTGIWSTPHKKQSPDVSLAQWALQQVSEVCALPVLEYILCKLRNMFKTTTTSSIRSHLSRTLASVVKGSKSQMNSVLLNQVVDTLLNEPLGPLSEIIHECGSLVNKQLEIKLFCALLGYITPFTSKGSALTISLETGLNIFDDQRQSQALMLMLELLQLPHNSIGKLTLQKLRQHVIEMHHSGRPMTRAAAACVRCHMLSAEEVERFITQELLSDLAGKDLISQESALLMLERLLPLYPQCYTPLLESELIITLSDTFHSGSSHFPTMLKSTGQILKSAYGNNEEKYCTVVLNICKSLCPIASSPGPFRNKSLEAWVDMVKSLSTGQPGFSADVCLYTTEAILNQQAPSLQGTEPLLHSLLSHLVLNIDESGKHAVLHYLLTRASSIDLIPSSAIALLLKSLTSSIPLSTHSYLLGLLSARLQNQLATKSISPHTFSALGVALSVSLDDLLHQGTSAKPTSA